MARSDDPLDLAARALRHRDRSRRDVEQRLERAGVEEGVRVDALETLARLGYVDDGRFAAGRAAALAARGLGDTAIRADLEGQGVDAEAVAEALAALAPEEERARALLERFGRSAKTAGRLLRKGFSPEVVEDAIGDVAEDDAGVV